MSLSPVLMTPRQILLYKWRVNIWRLVAPPVVGGLQTDPGLYGASPQFPSVPCFFDATQETDHSGFVGRTKAISLFVLDRFYFPWQYTYQGTTYAVDVQDTDMIEMVFVPGRSQQLIGVWWGVQGNVEPQTRLLQDQLVLCKRIGTYDIQKVAS